jgi:putative transcription factor
LCLIIKVSIRIYINKCEDIEIRAESMECEVCGREIRGRPVEVKIEGTQMRTCPGCARFGRESRGRLPVLPQRSGRSTPPRTGVGRRLPSPILEPAAFEWVEDYHLAIRRSREERGWTQEELGKRIHEKSSVIVRLESGKMVPDKKLAKKLERALGIKLLTPGGAGEVEKLPSSNRELTIGDVIQIRRKGSREGGT